jgi:hypothetical protein
MARGAASRAFLPGAFVGRLPTQRTSAAISRDDCPPRNSSFRAVKHPHTNAPYKTDLGGKRQGPFTAGPAGPDGGPAERHRIGEPLTDRGGHCDVARGPRWAL